VIDWSALKAANAPLGAFVDWDERTTGGAGPLAGLTLGVKSNIMVKGLPWTAGMGLYRNRTAPRDAEVVARMRRAGAAVLGSLNMQEAALGGHGDNPFFGRTQNPHRHGCTAGGSSSGSASAVAAGLSDIALGTDTMGSVRMPAAYCGIYGLKPTHGSVSNDGLALLEPELDCIGPLAASLDLIERAWRVMVDEPGERGGGFGRALVLQGLAGVQTEPAVVASYQRAIRALGLEPAELSLPHSPTAVRMAGFVAAGRWLIDDLGNAYRADSPDVSDELKFMLSVAQRELPRPDILTETRAALVKAIGDDAVLLMPAAPQSAFAHGTRPPANQADFTCLASVAGLPALALPAGWSDDSLPVGVQLVGPAGSELGLIALGRELDARLGAYRRPAAYGY
jgi:aspartyl-tRNA(Asn)/glutamyl-tRNA(Gln) amidotransferase subunit A